MKILYITTHFDALDSSAAVRNAALVRGLVANGHEVDVLTVKHAPEKVSATLSKTPCHQIFRTELGLTNAIYKTAKLQKKINNSWLRNIKKLLKELLFFPDVFVKWMNSVKAEEFSGYDVFISSSDCKTSHFLGWKMKKQYPTIRWIQIWGDPWTFDTTATFVTSLRAKYKEAVLLNKADKVVYVSALTCDAIRRKYPAVSEKLHYIPRSYFKEIYHTKEKKTEKVYRIIYSGSLHPGRSFDAFLSQVDKYNKTGKFIFQVIFYGNYLNDVCNKLSRYECTKVYPSVDYEEILNVYKSSDALLFISNEGGSTQIPGKLFDYMGTELPIICLVSGNPALTEFLQRYTKCILFEQDFASIADVILGGKFGIETSFSPRHIAEKVLE